MNIKALIATSLFAMTGILSGQVTAATESPTNNTMEKATAKKRVTPHDHTLERTGIRTTSKKTMPEQKAGNKASAANDKTKHFHPRDR